MGAGKSRDTSALTGLHRHAAEGNVRETLRVIEKLRKKDGEEGVARAMAVQVDGCTPVHWAALSGHLDTLMVLMRNGADINGEDGDEGATPLQNAASVGAYDVVSYLLALPECRVDARDQLGQTTLHFAAYGGVPKIGMGLLEREGIDIDAQDAEGRTALMWAVYRKHASFVRLLLHEGANADLQDTGGRTALMYAAHLNHRVICKRLIAADADLALRDDQHLTAADHAFHTGSDACLELLTRAGAAPSDLTFAADPETARPSQQLHLIQRLRDELRDTQRQLAECRRARGTTGGEGEGESEGEGEGGEAAAGVGPPPTPARATRGPNKFVKRKLRESAVRIRELEDALEVERERVRVLTARLVANGLGVCSEEGSDGGGSEDTSGGPEESRLSSDEYTGAGGESGGGEEGVAFNDVYPVQAYSRWTDGLDDD